MWSISAHPCWDRCCLPMVKFQRVLQKMARVTVAQKQLGGKVRRENEVCKLPVLGFPSTKGGLQNWSWKSRHNSSLLRKESPALDLGRWPPGKYRIKTRSCSADITERVAPAGCGGPAHPRAALAPLESVGGDVRGLRGIR